ncbi:MAG: peptide ABC transporter substrate-binding protein [Candidatus Promineifilaceae bacterium]|nr:peptide ABC transporter substrate-binding protein [Candidatus Promineifilaceae bacterium]
MTTKPNIGWPLLLAALCLGLVSSLLSYQAQTAGLCSTRVPAAGGTFAEGIVGAPQHLNPLLADANPVDREISSLLFDGLTRYDEDGRLVPALAESWRVSEDGRRVDFSLRDDAVWHDGEAVTAEDVVFSYGLLQDEAFPAPAGARTLWESVTISSTGELSVTFTLPESYSPFLEATTRGIVPAHILGDVSPARIPDHDFNQMPVGTGPFMVPAGENWQRTGRLRLVPTRDHWRQGVKLDAIEFRFYPDAERLLEAYTAGEIQAINSVPPSRFPEVATLPDTRLYTAPLPRYTQALFNLTDEGMGALRNRDVRHALAYALDRELLVDRALNGQGLVFDGPYPPTSWAYHPDALTIYPYRPLSATQTLENAGWTLPEGGMVREGETETLILRLLLVDEPQYRRVADELASQWAAVGVGVEINAEDAETFAAALGARDFDVALVEVAAPGDPDLYDFWSQEAIVRGQNYAGWNHRRASEALEQARQLWDVGERRRYYEAFLQYFSNDLPALTLYQHAYTYAVSESVNELEIGRIDHPRDRYETFPDWFLLYRDVAVACPEE